MLGLAVVSLGLYLDNHIILLFAMVPELSHTPVYSSRHNLKLL